MANEKRLIDANELKSKLQEHYDFFVDGWGGFDKMSFATKCRVDEIDNCIAEIVNAPTVSAVEVIRCKDCRFIIDRADGTHGCYRNFAEDCKIDDFCSYGERKDND